ncbi:MAG: APC family permease [Anaerolineales bacterium]|nr:APC family permease [Anaerolineales bacterium]
MLDQIKRVLIGPPLATSQQAEKRLNKIQALAAFSPDALSSIAYANQEIYLGLMVAGAAGLSNAWPIGITITIVLITVAFSYFQTIHGYPGGGGSYVVARENLGTVPGLVAAAALMVDYMLNAAVSLTAGVAALASAFPVLWQYRVEASLILLLVITIINLRGLQETGTVMSIPVYLFLGTYFPLLIYGAFRLWQGGVGNLETAIPVASQPLTMFLVLRTFASGCTALTGIEAISNGVPVFKPPEARNAGRTLIVMAVLMSLLFLGSNGLIQALGVVAVSGETILSALARKLLGSGTLYLLIQTSTLLILTVAANTSFAGFPRITALLAKDGFLPRQLTGLGDRLVFVNGIILLAFATGVLIVAFGGDSHALIPLFAVSAFMAFTISQFGMVVHWWRERGSNWILKITANILGGIVTVTVLLVIGVSQFLHGAWISILVIPALVYGFFQIRAHYRDVSKQLSLRGLPPELKPFPPMRCVIPISGVHRGMVDAIRFAQSISKDVTVVYVNLEPGKEVSISKDWKNWWPDIPLVILASPYRSIVTPLLEYLDETDRQWNDGRQAVVILPEFVPAKWWHTLLHNQTSFVLKTELLYHRRQFGYQRVIIDVPFHLRK